MQSYIFEPTVSRQKRIYNMTQNSSVMTVVGNNEIRSALVDLLKINDYEATGAATVSEAVVKVQREQVDLILTDLDLPLSESLAAARRIRSSAARSEVPIVVIANDDTVDLQTGELAPGSNEYVVKLIDLDQLINLLSRVLHKYPNAA